MSNTGTGFSPPISFGSSAINTLLQTGGALRNGFLSVYCDHVDCLKVIIGSFISSAQSVGPVLFAFRTGDFSVEELIVMGVDTSRNIAGSRLTIVNYECVEELKAFLLFQAFDAYVIYDNSSSGKAIDMQLNELLSYAPLANSAMLYATQKSNTTSITAAYSSLFLTDVEALKNDAGGLYGWQFTASAESRLAELENNNLQVTTIITKESRYFEAYDTLNAGILCGVLRINETGQVLAGDRLFTQTYADAVQRMQDGFVRLRLNNAITTRLPYVRL